MSFCIFYDLRAHGPQVLIDMRFSKVEVISQQCSLSRYRTFIWEQAIGLTSVKLYPSLIAI